MLPKMQRFSIRSKILLGYLVVLLLFGISLSVLSVQIHTLQEENDYISHHDLEVHNLTNTIEKNVLNMETGQRGYMLTGEEDYLEPYRSANSEWNSNYNLLYELIGDNPTQQRNLEMIRNHIERWLEVAGEPAIALKKEGSPDEVLAFFRADPGKNEIDLLRDQLTRFRDTELQLTDARVSELSVRSSVLLKAIYALWFAITAISVAAALAISGNIVKTLKEVIQTISDISRGGSLTQRVHVRSRDEVGDLGMETNRLLDAVQEQNRIKERIAAMATMLQNQSTLESLSQLYLNHLSIVLEVPYGVLYHWNKHQQLTNLASYAASGELLKPNQTVLNVGEGLVGQCVAEKRMLHLHDLPPGYIRISSGLGYAEARSLTVAPVLFEGKVISVVEIAALQPLSQDQAALLSELNEIFGVSLHSVMTRMELQQLYDESQVLNEELQAQSERLQQQTEELASQTEELQMQTEELHVLNDRLEEQKSAAELSASEMAVLAEQLRASSGYKSEFLANMSHELRTPLNSMLILSEILAANKQGHLDAEEQKYASVIHASGKDLLHLINDILDLSKVEAGKMDMAWSNVRIADLPEAMYRYFQKMAEQKGLDFRVILQGELPEYIETDEMRLQQILRNLLSNAFKFTSKGEVILTISRMHLDGSHKDGKPAEFVSFSVSDTGIGIHEDQLQPIFEAFKQADGATARKYGGTGLGLSISQSLANLLGGSISVTSRIGEGSTFSLILPLNRGNGVVSLSPSDAQGARLFLNEAAAAAERSGQNSMDEEPDWKTDPWLTPLEKTLLHGKEVFVVDDDIRNVYALANALEQYGMKIATAQNGHECLEMLERGEVQPDIIMMDIMMPELDGYEATRQIRNRLGMTRIPIIALTAKAMKEDRDKCLAAGASDYISKPLNMSEVISRMKLWLGS